jgi:simple sugar transport system ATP-binding protein
VAVNPIRGIDINATEFIHQQLLRKKEGGCCILLISTDLEELFDISDRIAVIFGGKIMGVGKPTETSKQEIGIMMMGIKTGEAI